eukprot:377728_1
MSTNKNQQNVWRIRGSTGGFYGRQQITFYKSQPLFIQIKQTYQWHKATIENILYDPTVDEQYKLKIKYWTHANSVSNTIITINKQTNSTRFINNITCVKPNTIDDTILFGKAHLNSIIEYFHNNEWRNAKIINTESNNKITLQITNNEKSNLQITKNLDSLTCIRRKYPTFFKSSNNADKQSYCLCGSPLTKQNSLVTCDKYYVKHKNTRRAIGCNNCGAVDIVYTCRKDNTTSNSFCIYNLCKSCAIFFSKDTVDILSELNEVYIYKLMEMIIPSMSDYKRSWRNIAEYGINKWNNFRLINKHWHHVLDASQSFSNRQWKIFCMMDFPNMRFYANKMKVKRWDKYYKYKKREIKYKPRIDEGTTHQTMRTVGTRIQSLVASQDYREYGLIENCQHDIIDIEEINHDNIEKKDDDTFKDLVNDNGLPSGFKWNFKCPITFDRLKKIDEQTFYCDQCDKNVYRVNSTKQLEEKVKQNECVTYTVLQAPKPRRRVLGGIGAYSGRRDKKLNSFRPY